MEPDPSDDEIDTQISYPRERHLSIDHWLYPSNRRPTKKLKEPRESKEPSAKRRKAPEVSHATLASAHLRLINDMESDSESDDGDNSVFCLATGRMQTAPSSKAPSIASKAACLKPIKRSLSGSQVSLASTGTSVASAGAYRGRVRPASRACSARSNSSSVFYQDDDDDGIPVKSSHILGPRLVLRPPMHA